MDGTSGSTRSTGSVAGIPPFFQAMVKHHKRNVVFTVTTGNRTSRVYCAHGRVAALNHDRVSTDEVTKLLARSGLLEERELKILKKTARSRGVSLEQALIESGMVSSETLDNIRGSLCLELLMELLLHADASVKVEALEGRTEGVECALPIRFLLREAQKRSQALPEIKKVVPNSSAVFARKEAITGKRAASWAELEAGSTERQVYFYLDGRRTVADLVRLTCRPEFRVAKALKRLADKDLVRRVTPVGGGRVSGAERKFGRTGALVMTAILLVGSALGIRWFVGKDDISAPALEDVLREAGAARLKAAAAQYVLIHGEPADSLDELIEENLVVLEDLHSSR